VEKRFALFLVLSALILFSHLMLQNLLAPPQPIAVDDQEQAAEDVVADDDTGQPPEDTATPAEAPGAVKPPGGEEPEVAAPPEETIAPELVTLGSLDADSPFRLLVTLNNRGAAIERMELNERTPSGKFRYRDLDRNSGYLGHLELTDDPSGGCRVQVVGAGTPAALAKPLDADTPLGLRAGDSILQLDGSPVRSAFEFEGYLSASQPGQTVRVEISRTLDDGATRRLVFEIVLTDEPLSIVRPEVNPHADTNRRDPLSFLFSLHQIGGKSIVGGKDEISGLPSLRDGLWQVAKIEDNGNGPAVEFRRTLSAADLKKIGVEGELECIKRYRLVRSPEDGTENSTNGSYHLSLEIEIRNLGQSTQKFAYQLDGATGLPLEGWWYSNKTHPSKFSGVGARDVGWRTATSGHGLIGAPQIYKEAKKAEQKGLPQASPLFPVGQEQVVEYIGGDAQYFCVVMLTDPEDEPAKASFQQALAMPAGSIGDKPKQWVKTTNTTFRLVSPERMLEAGQTYSQTFTIFAGPKKPALLKQYALEDFIAYGWFRMIARPLSWVLHFFEKLPLVNYGLAIILLTVLVRSAMTPLSRKAAKNAQMMQELAPEMKRIAEKYKNDMEKRAAAQRELFAKHNYNPFGGCWLMFIQLPIFIGLYRALSVDIELLQAPLIPGLDWCSNLAGPDMLWYWKPYLWDVLADPGIGWLGPYLNVLPMITIVLFLLQQKMFMPPATDEQTRMQQQMMKFMMIFMGVLFFRVPSGLCVYFIASSLWGIAERKMLPPPGKAGASGATGKPPAADVKARAEADAKKARIKGRQKKR